MLDSAGSKEGATAPPDDQHQVQLHRTFRKLVGGTNINEQTLLATDYLNHFNEVVMLIEMIADMPECLEDVKAWAPKSYQDHFRDSSFSDRELAVQAYEHAPERYRAPFEQVVAGLNHRVATGLQEIEQALETTEDGRIRDTVSTVSQQLQGHIDKAGAIIHGDQTVLDQVHIDDIMKD